MYFIFDWQLKNIYIYNLSSCSDYLSIFLGGCLGIKLSGRGSKDGLYYMKLKAKCEGFIRLYCSGMNTSSPKEYISLKSGVSRNYAFIYDYKQPEAAKTMCDRKPGKSF